MALYFIPFLAPRGYSSLGPSIGLKLGLPVGGSVPPFLVLLRRGIRRIAGFPAWHACRFGVLSASISIPRPWAAALAYSVMMVDHLSLTRCGFQRSRCVGFWGHGASPCAPGGQASTGFSVYILSRLPGFVKTFFQKSWKIFCPRFTAPPLRCGGFASVLPSSALFLSDARRCWFTLIYRTTGLRAVGDFIVEVLRTLMGHTLTSSVSWALLPFPLFLS